MVYHSTEDSRKLGEVGCLRWRAIKLEGRFADDIVYTGKGGWRGSNHFFHHNASRYVVEGDIASLDRAIG